MPEEIKSVIEDAQHAIYLSIVSLWEMAIKVSLSKLELSQSLKDITAEVDKSRIQWLPLASTHIQRLATLPFHHRDPFDRTIIAQGLVEEVTII
ncbi:MAG: type II toxin-antitoxin system VapC family toxin, partial [Tunicatimonas sp.]|uniref:type II toxin-antitoxin system VapC family toxin n=1 Tax=Tunicatimonas sp. TaxID=1940096 RepID=UPI003C711352